MRDPVKGTPHKNDKNLERGVEKSPSAAGIGTHSLPHDNHCVSTTTSESVPSYTIMKHVLKVDKALIKII